MRVERFSRGWLVAHESARDELQQLGWLRPEVLVDLPGEIVSGHPDRHVREIVGSSHQHVYYLKREHRVPWRERWKNRLAGFGWASKSDREAQVLMRIGDLGPRWLAFGEDGQGRAFLLLAEIGGVPLTQFLRTADEHAQRWAGVRVGEWLNRLHALGVDQPDLFAKHLRIDPDDGSVRALDWQRARRLRSSSAEARLRSVSAFANCEKVPGTVSQSLCETVRVPFSQVRPLRRRRPSPEDDPDPVRFVWIDEEAICAVPSVEADLRHLSMRELLDAAPDRDVRSDEVRLPVSGLVASLTRRRFRWPASRAMAKLRGRNWRSPELIAARRLVEMRRHDRTSTQLLGFGQRLTRFGGTSFLLTAR